MKKILIICLSCSLLLLIVSCASNESAPVKEMRPTPTASSSMSTTSPPKATTDNYNSNSYKSSSSFSNKYGTQTTKCNHSGCNNYIATSGDTNCCTVHSKNVENADAILMKTLCFVWIV